MSRGHHHIWLWVLCFLYIVQSEFHCNFYYFYCIYILHVIINNIAWSSLHSYTVILLFNSSSILAYYSIYISKLTLCHVYLKVHLMPTVRPSIYQLVFLSAADWYIFCYRKFSCVAVPRGSSIIDFSLPLSLMFRSSKVLFQYKDHLSSYRNLHAVECMKGNKTSVYDHCQLTLVIWMLSFHLWKELLLYLSVSFLYSHTNIKNPTMHFSHIPQYTIQNRNVHISVLNVVLWDLWIWSITCLLNGSVIDSIVFSLTYVFRNVLAHSLIFSLIYSFVHSLIYSFAHSLTHLLEVSL